VAQAGVVIENGLGYDAFVDKLVTSTHSHARVVTVADVLPIDSANPHLWYDVERMPQIAAAIERALAAADPAHAGAYRDGLARFRPSLEGVLRELQKVREDGAGAPVAYTEPVPGDLVRELGLRNLAPAAFTRAVEDGSEPSPSATAAMEALIADHRIRVLLYNSQTVSPLTTRIRTAALAARIGVVAVTETLPPGLTYQEWQLRQLRALDAALAR
jgi:zinc/manganese transport system substrate-binding protein